MQMCDTARTNRVLMILQTCYPDAMSGGKLNLNQKYIKYLMLDLAALATLTHWWQTQHSLSHKPQGPQ